MTITADVKPVPAYVKRIRTADIGHGETVGTFQIWPTARPALTVEAGEKLAISLRIRALTPDSGTLGLGSGVPDSWKLRREKNGDYWLDISLEGTPASSRSASLVVEGSNAPQPVRIQTIVSVPTENFVVTPKELDFGEQSLSSTSTGLLRFGVRKVVGAFHIKSLTSTLPFLKFEQTTMVEGSNYLIRVTIDRTKQIKAGSFDGRIVLETDDDHRVELPVSVKFVEK